MTVENETLAQGQPAPDAHKASPIVPLSRRHLAGWGFSRFTDYGFIQDSPMVQLGLNEAIPLALQMPLLIHRAPDNLFSILGLLKLPDGRNRHLNDSSGFRGYRVPALFRMHPLLPGKSREGAWIACVNTGSPWVSRDGSGEAFFDESGALNSEITPAMELIKATCADFDAAQTALSALDDLGLLSPMTGFAHNIPLEFLTIKEDAVNNCSQEAIFRLHQTGAYALFLAHNQSLIHLKALLEMANQGTGSDTTRPADQFSEEPSQFLLALQSELQNENDDV